MTDMLRRWQIGDFGRQHLQQVEAPVPQPGPGQILVRVEAASLNYRDLLLTDDRYGWTPPSRAGRAASGSSAPSSRAGSTVQRRPRRSRWVDRGRVRSHRTCCSMRSGRWLRPPH